MPHSDPTNASPQFSDGLTRLTRLGGPGSTPASSEGSPPHSTAAADGLAARRLSIAKWLTFGGCRFPFQLLLT